MDTFDVLIIGGSAAGLSCALILGSAVHKPFASNNKIGIVVHQKSSALNEATLNNVLGLKKGTRGNQVLADGLTQLSDLYPHIIQIDNEKVSKIEGEFPNFTVITNKNSYLAKSIVVAVGPSNLFNIEGLMQYVIPHYSLPPQKERTMLKNNNHLVAEGIYTAGVLAGWKSQFAIAAGSGSQVATDMLILWNDGNHSVVHDSLIK